jgi:hypothetical protein
MTKEELIETMRQHAYFTVDFGKKGWQAFDHYVAEHWPGADLRAARKTAKAAALPPVVELAEIDRLPDLIGSFVDEAFEEINREAERRRRLKASDIYRTKRRREDDG